MQNWQDLLNANPLPWLLEQENPSVRLHILKDICSLPVDDREVQAAQSAADSQPLVQDIFARQMPGGHWGSDESKPYTAEGALGVLSLLYLLGVTPNEKTAAGCDSLLRNSQNENGGLSMTRTLRSGIFPCTTPEQLPFLVYFGMEEDPRVQAAFEFLITAHSAENALDCGRYQHRPCLWGGIAALNGLAGVLSLPAGMRSPRSQQVVNRLADALLGAAYDFDGEHKRWLTFGVPRGWDLLSALKALAAHGYASDPRFRPLMQRVLDLQDAGGRWQCGSASRTWPLEKRGQPSKWVTLDVLRVLKAMN